MMGKKSSSRRTECTRRGRRASCGPRDFDGSQDPKTREVNEIATSMTVEAHETYVRAGGIALQVRFNGFVLLVE